MGVSSTNSNLSSSSYIGNTLSLQPASASTGLGISTDTAAAFSRPSNDDLFAVSVLFLFLLFYALF